MELTSVTDDSLVPQVLARALKLSIQNENTLADALVEALQAKQLLMVLDNCEHLLEVCASLAGSLLQTAGVHLLTTSREPLFVPGETLYPVSPLALLLVASGNVQNYDAVPISLKICSS